MTEEHKLIKDLVDELQPYSVAHPSHQLPALEAGHAWLLFQPPCSECGAMTPEDAISKQVVAKAYADPSWVYKLNLDCVEEEDGSMTIHIEWDEKDPDLQYWTNLGPKKQENFILTALRSACNSALSDHVD